uniref:Uncharacterized protein n=1 Tax=Meloidogyne incognita TaxID=6306 RepID=A0A914MV08_MELIC
MTGNNNSKSTENLPNLIFSSSSNCSAAPSSSSNSSLTNPNRKESKEELTKLDIITKKLFNWANNLFIFAGTSNNNNSVNLPQEQAETPTQTPKALPRQTPKSDIPAFEFSGCYSRYHWMGSSLLFLLRTFTFIKFNRRRITTKIPNKFN